MGPIIPKTMIVYQIISLWDIYVDIVTKRSNQVSPKIFNSPFLLPDDALHDFHYKLQAEINFFENIFCKTLFFHHSMHQI